MVAMAGADHTMECRPHGLGAGVHPFCAVFFLLAFKNAWQNWQLRTGRLGSALDYLTTTERFWPG